MAGNVATGNPSINPPAGITSSITTPGAAATTVQAQISTITIGGTIDTGDVFTANLPGSVTATYTALNGDDANAVATGLNAAILASSGYAGQAFDSTVLTNVVTLTAKGAGTGFTVTSGATNYAGVSAVAQQDTLTPASVTVGETFVVDIGGTKYAHVATTTLADDVVTGLTTKINADVSSVVTPSGTSTLILTANIAGTPFTATPSVIGVADAANSTLAITSSSLTVGGATTTATLTLKDDAGTTLIDVSGTGATIVSADTAVFTVGAPTRSQTNGTVTATVSAAGAGSVNLTATLDGSAAVTQTQAVTVSAAPAAPNFNSLVPTLSSTTDRTATAGSSLPLYRFKLATGGIQTLNSVAVLIANPLGSLAASDIAGIALYKIANDGTATQVGSTQTTVAVDGSTATSISAGAMIDSSVTYTVFAQLKASAPTDGASFTVTIPANAITLSGSSPTNSLAAGTAKITIDTVVPTLSNDAVGSVTSSSIALSVQSSKTGTAYYVVLPAAAGAPSATQVVSGQDGSGATATIKGNGALTASTLATFAVSGLDASTAYKAYYVVTDAAGNHAVSSTVANVQSFTTLAAAVVDSGSSTPPASTTPPATATVPTGTTVPVGTTLTPVGSVSTVFSGNTGSGVTVSGGTIAINTSSMTPGTSPLVLSSSVPEGTGIVLSAQTPGSNTPPPPVNLTIGGQNLAVTPSGTGNTLLSTTTVQVNGQPQQAVTVLSGSASLSASATDQVLCTVPSLNSNSPVVISSNSNSSSTLVTSSPSGSTITASSGSVQLTGASLTDYSVTVTADHHALITKFLIGSDSINHFSAASTGSFTLYAGETLTLNTAGQVTAITVTSSSGKGGAGDAITAPAPLTFNGSVPLLNATSARLGKKLQQGIADALGATLNGDQSSSGVLSLNTAGGTVTVLPVGAVRINPNDTDGLGLGSDGLIYVTRSGITVGFAPSVADPVQFAADLAKALPDATVSISTSGAFVVKAGNATYAVQPAWTASKSTGTAGFSTGSDGALRYSDAQGNQSVLLPAFIDSYAAQQIVAAAVTGSTATVNTDGTITLKAGSVSYTLTPDLGLATVNSSGVPSVLEGKSWWVDNGKLFLNTAGGVQGVNVR